MHKLAQLTSQAAVLDKEINDYFESKGYDIDKLRSGDGTTLDELNYGNDVTEIFVNDFENGKYEYCRDKGWWTTKFFLRKGIMKMTIKDILTVTGGRTKVVILSTDEKEKYITLWYGNVDDIDFEHVPFGNYEVEHVTVINGEDVLQLHFEYPELTKQERDAAGREAVGYPYPTEWIERLFVKYRDWNYIKELLVTKDKEEIYNEIRVVDY